MSSNILEKKYSGLLYSDATRIYSSTEITGIPTDTNAVLSTPDMEPFNPKIIRLLKLTELDWIEISPMERIDNANLSTVYFGLDCMQDCLGVIEVKNGPYIDDDNCLVSKPYLVTLSAYNGARVIGASYYLSNNRLNGFSVTLNGWEQACLKSTGYSAGVLERYSRLPTDPSAPYNNTGYFTSDMVRVSGQQYAVRVSNIDSSMDLFLSQFSKDGLTPVATPFGFFYKKDGDCVKLMHRSFYGPVAYIPLSLT